MLKKPPRLVSRKSKKLYSTDQSALYKVGSKKRLAKILGAKLSRLLLLRKSASNYKEFILREQICPFTRKVRKKREVQEPKTELRCLHNRILRLLRFVVPPAYTHAAVKRRSYRSNADFHKDGSQVATLDIQTFYKSTTSSRVYDFWEQQMRCAPDVARLLRDLTCYNDGLPTGSPLSPLLSLFVNKPLFDELNLLALKFDLSFTCYIDDLTFSGDRITPSFLRLVKKAVERRGHVLAPGKTKIFGSRQRKHVTGVVIFNHAIDAPYRRFLKARGINRAVKSTKNSAVKVELLGKLAGLYSEASYLDPKYSRLAKRSYARLKVVETRVKNQVGDLMLSLGTPPVSINIQSASVGAGELPF